MIPCWRQSWPGWQSWARIGGKLGFALRPKPPEDEREAVIFGRQGLRNHRVELVVKSCRMKKVDIVHSLEQQECTVIETISVTIVSNVVLAWRKRVAFRRVMKVNGTRRHGSVSVDENVRAWHHSPFALLGRFLQRLILKQNRMKVVDCMIVLMQAHLGKMKE